MEAAVLPPPAVQGPSETPMRRVASTTVLPEAMITSASLSLLMISSAVCFLFGKSHPTSCDLLPGNWSSLSASFVG